MQIRCRCGHQMAVKPEEAGSTVRCPTCSTLLKVPAAVAQVPAGVAPAASPTAPAPRAPARPALRPVDVNELSQPSSAGETEQRVRPKLSAAAREQRLLWLILAGLIGTALLMLFFFVRTAVDYRAAQSWVEVPAQIASVQLEESVRTSYRKGRRRETTTDTVKARYSYELDGRRFEGNRVSVQEGSRDREIYNELRTFEQSGRPFRCYVNTANPREAVLYRDLDPIGMVVLGGLALGFGAGAALLSWQLRGKAKAAG